MTANRAYELASSVQARQYRRRTVVHAPGGRSDPFLPTMHRRARLRSSDAAAAPFRHDRRYAAEWLHRQRAADAMTSVLVVGDPVDHRIRRIFAVTATPECVVGACLPEYAMNDGAGRLSSKPPESRSWVMSMPLSMSSSQWCALPCWLAAARWQKLRWISWRSKARTQLVVSWTHRGRGQPSHIRPVAGLPLVHVEEPGSAVLAEFSKEPLTASPATTALLLLSPVLFAVAIAVKTTSAGPTFFAQTRVGRDGKRFSILKFRSMSVDAEERKDELLHLNENDGPTFKMECDPRVTRIGRVMRKYSLDELPQLINVVKGEMSLVGPRPPLPGEGRLRR